MFYLSHHLKILSIIDITDVCGCHESLQSKPMERAAALCSDLRRSRAQKGLYHSICYMSCDNISKKKLAVRCCHSGRFNIKPDFVSSVRSTVLEGATFPAALHPLCINANDSVAKRFLLKSFLT